jgi:hypothetical protein
MAATASFAPVSEEPTLSHTSYITHISMKMSEKQRDDGEVLRSLQ